MLFPLEIPQPTSLGQHPVKKHQNLSSLLHLTHPSELKNLLKKIP